jgi:hypothetical protein
MSSDLTPGQKAVRTRKRRAAAAKAITTRKRMNIIDKRRAAEAASKEALRAYCEEHKWRVAFFEGKTGAPRTGIIDAIIFRISRQNADVLDLRLVQLKGGSAGVSGMEIKRLKKASEEVVVNWLIAAFDGTSLHLVPEPELMGSARSAKAEVKGNGKRDRRAAALEAWKTIRRKRAEAAETALTKHVVLEP